MNLMHQKISVCKKPQCCSVTCSWGVSSLWQVFMLDTQCSPKTPNNKEGFEHAQSCVLIIELPSDQQSNGHAQKRWEKTHTSTLCSMCLESTSVILIPYFTSEVELQLPAPIILQILQIQNASQQGGVLCKQQTDLRLFSRVFVFEWLYLWVQLLKCILASA